MTRSPRKSRETSVKTAVASQDEPTCHARKGDEAVNRLHEALRPHFENLREELEKEAAAQPEGDRPAVRWEYPADGVEDDYPGTTVAEKRLADLEEKILKERDAFERVLPGGAGPKQDAILSQEWLATSSELLMALLRSEFLVRIGDGEQEVRLPVEAIGRVAKLLENLSEGRLPDRIEAAISMNGHPGYWPSERRDIAFAIFYIDAVKKGDIADRAYNKTVAEAFDVDRTTVQKWVRNSDRICANVGRPGVRSLKQRMLQAAKQYRSNRNPSNWLVERRNIAIAIFYIDAVKKGDIPDRDYTQTVADAFEVDPSDVQEWMRNRNEICVSVTCPGVALLKKQMLQAAGRYRSNRNRSERTATKGSAAEKT